LDSIGDTSPLYTSWRANLSLPCESIDPDLNDNWQPPENCGLVVTASHYRDPTAGILTRILRENRIPVLILADGVLDFRNTWQNARIAEGSVFQPVLGHKLACIGAAQARMVESWGNVGKCEVVGLPRLDQFSKKSKRVRKASDPFTLIVLTATTPAFNPQQFEVLNRSLADVRDQVAAHNAREPNSIKLLWRLAPEAACALKVVNHESWESRSDLSSILKSVDGMISTPSTTLLEGMLNGIPVASLNYWNSPQFTPTAWNIACAEQIPSVLSEFKDPPGNKMLFQEYCLSDTLECDGLATNRMVKLIEEMVKVGQKGLQDGGIELPTHILTAVDYCSPTPRYMLNFSRLYERFSTGKDCDVTLLRLELGHARLEQTHLRKERVRILDELNKLSTLLETTRSEAEFAYTELDTIKKSRSYRLFQRIANFKNRFKRWREPYKPRRVI